MTVRPKKSFRINGRVVDRKPWEGVSDLRIEAWDKDFIVNDLVGSAITDEQGYFQIEFDDSGCKEIFLDRHPDLFLKVLRGDVLIKSTEDCVLWNMKARDTQLVIQLGPGQATAA